MKQPSPEIVAKAKELEPLWRMDIYVGCWVVVSGVPRIRLVQNPHDVNYYQKVMEEKYWFPIPDISDCLEKLAELGWFIISAYDAVGSSFHVELGSTGGRRPGIIKGKRNKVEKTLHLALLSALCEVMKND